MKIDNKGTLADLNLMINGNISLAWIQECLKPENQDMKVHELLTEYRNKNDNAELFNTSILLMASYLFFVYAKEKDFNGRDYSFVDISKFKVTDCEENNHDSNYICRRVRNALAHSRVHIDENLQMTFEDFKLIRISRTDYRETDYFRCTISCVDFGNFINDFMLGLKDRYFSKRV